MSATILGGDVTVYYLDETRQKRLEWTGAAGDTRTANELYSALEDLMDESLQSDDGSVMSAETPVEYTIGIIDAGDLDPWYASYDLMEHITGGAIKTASWARVEGSNTGIIVVPVDTGGTIVTGDIGNTITMTIDGDTGTLLDIIERGAIDYFIIRPATNAAGNSFDNAPTAGGAMTCNGHTADQNAASVTGEQIWANLYNVTPIDPDTHIYMYQGTVSDAARARIGRISAAAGDWWPEGAFDRLFYIRDFTTAASPLIDGGYISVYARKGNTLYDNFEVACSTISGGRNPVPLKASADLNHTTGYQSITTTAVPVDDFAVGDVIEGDNSGARAVITLIEGSDPTYTVHYYLIGDPQITFDTAAEGISSLEPASTGQMTKNGSAPADQGPALATWFTSNTAPTATHANTTYDIDDGGLAEGYGITIDCNANPLTEVYEWLQHICRNGETSTTNTDGVEGEQYVGATVYLEYSGTVTLGTIGEGDDVVQTSSLATGVVISHDTTLKQILLRDTRGTFVTGADPVVSQDNSGSINTTTVATTFAAYTDAPFGRLAGGRFFGARGVLLADWLAADENNFQLVDSAGNVRTRPIAITLEVTNLSGGAESVGTNDLVSLHRLTGSGGVIDKTEYTAAGGETQGSTTLDVDAAISADTPGKLAGGTLVLRDATDAQEYKLRFASWSGVQFTLASITAITGDTGTNATTVIHTAKFGSAKRGDFVYNITRLAWAYVLTVDSANQITLDRSITGQVPSDTFEINTTPNITVAASDDVYVPLMNRYATAAAEQVSIVYTAPLYYRAKVTNKRGSATASPVTKIKPFVTADATTGTSRSIAVIRNADTIAA